MELFSQPLDRGVYHLPNPDDEGRVHLYAVDGDGVLAVPPEPVEPGGFAERTVELWDAIGGRDSRAA